MSGDLDECVGEAAGKRTIVAGAGGSCQREDGGLDGRRGDGIEEATDGEEPTVAGNELTAVACGGADLLVEDRGRVRGMTGVGAVVAEAADRVLAGEIQEGALVEADGAGRCTSSGSGPAVAGHPGIEGRSGSLTARATLARSEKWAKPISPASRAATLAGNRPICSPAATDLAAAWADIRQ